MAEIRFTKDEKARIVLRIQSYFAEELKQDMGSFDAEFLLDFFAGQIGPYFYNRGLHDAQAAVSGKLETLGDAIYQLELPTEFHK